MMKRLFCLTLVAVMLLSVFAFSFSAAEVNDKAVTGADVIKFDNSITKWTGPVQFYIYDPEGEELIPWGSKRLNGTDEGNNIWSKDLSDYGLESGKQYCIIFCDASTGAQTYDLVFDASCFGDTAVTTNNLVENPVDSNKNAGEAVWKNSTLGPRLQVTSIGNVVGQTCLASETPYDLFVGFLENTFENARVYSGKDDQTLIDDTAGALGLSKNDVEAALSEAGAYTNWDYDKSNLPGEGSSGGSSGSGSGSSGSSGGSSGYYSDISGKWHTYTFASDQFTDDEKKIFSSVMKSNTNVLYLPSQVIAKQTDDSGTYYVFLTSVTELKTDVDAFFDSIRWEITTIFVDNQGNSKLLNSAAIDPADIKTTDKAPDGWTVSAKTPSADDLSYYSSDVKQALTNYKEIKLDYIAELATRIVDTGINYRFLCYGTKDGKTDLYVVELTDEFTKAEITKVSLFDLSSYAISPQPAEKGPDNSAKSPATGNTDMVMMVVVLLFIAMFGACVSVKQISKKHD